MVHMIPDWVSSKIESSAEAKLFRAFQKYETSESIYVLHSLGLGEHISNIFGEIDFVIICSRGVLCAEVKGGNVYRDNGIWYFQNRYMKKDKSPKGPFKQVQGNAQSLRNYINGRFPAGNPLHGLQYACCVLTPDCHIDIEDSEIIQEILFDNSFYWDLGTVISESFRYWEGVLDDRHGFKGKGLNEKGISDLAVSLRGDFRFVPPMKNCYDEINRHMLALTDEQFDVLENHKKNKRMLVEGCAGTGKTLLAVEQCRREVLEGRKVLCLCYNYNIAQNIRETLAGVCDVYTLHALIMHLCGEDDGQNKGRDYFESLLPRFLAMDTPDKYDVLVVDEGQDLLKEQYIRCMDKLLEGGMNRGRWTVYYDPNQNVYGGNEELGAALEEYGEIATQVTLSVNCRNTKNIADTNRALTGYDQAKHARVDGTKVKWRRYKSLGEELEKLLQDLEYLKKEEVDCNRIVLLSPWAATDSRCCLMQGVIPASLGKLKTKKPWSAYKDEIRFSTINTFKGLEADVIMLLDTDAFRDETRRMQNYVAVSRARTDLYIYYSETSAEEKDSMVMENLGL